jgi:hypothetical protein
MPARCSSSADDDDAGADDGDACADDDDACASQIVYQLLQPGTQGSQPTYVSHPWIARDVATGRRMMLGGSMVGRLLG